MSLKNINLDIDDENQLLSESEEENDPQIMISFSSIEQEKKEKLQKKTKKPKKREKIEKQKKTPARKERKKKDKTEVNGVKIKKKERQSGSLLTGDSIELVLEDIINQVQNLSFREPVIMPDRYQPPPPPTLPTSISYFTKGLQTSFSVPSMDEMTRKFERLRTLPLPEQRTDAWYQFRHNRLTASDLGMLFGTPSEYQTCLLRKCRTLTEVKSARSGGGAACQHGIKYEDVAISLYEYRNSVKVHDFGCIPHATLECFAASPDGICDTQNPVYAGRMVEIKCPYSRKLGPTTNPHPIKDVYWAQMQGQLEVCDLPFCDFLECIIKEYPSEEEFWNDSDGSERCQKNGMEKGVVATSPPPENKFYYSPLGLGPSEIKRWCQKHRDRKCQLTFWRLEQYVCRLVARNPDWWSQVQPHVEYFWSQVEHYRRESKFYLYPQKIQKRITSLFNPKSDGGGGSEEFKCILCQQKFLINDNLVPHPNKQCELFFHQDCLEKFWARHQGQCMRFPNDTQDLLSTCLLDSSSDEE